jgi:preprotein translocase subunit SecD
MENLRMRTTLVIIGLIAAVLTILPNFVNMGEKWPFQTKLNYGLDIQGGLHLVMGVDVPGVVKESVTRLSGSLKSELEKEGITISEIRPTKPELGEMEVLFPSADLKEKIVSQIENRYANMLQVIGSTETQISLRYYDAYLADYKTKVIQQAIETIRNRIDEFGVAEPSISAQGTDRILVQLPGMADAERAKELINTAAKLDFMLVADEVTPADLPQMIADAEKAGNYSLETMKYSDYIARLNQDLKSKLPEKTVVLFERDANSKDIQTGRIPYLLYEQVELGGADLDDAFVGFDQYGAPEVSLRFNALGASKFKKLTAENIRKRMAVVLDRVVKTAPVIQVEIGTGSAVITLGGSRDRNAAMNEAKMISMALRAGSLPASLEQLEERRVGPSLGADSVNKAVRAAWIGALVIFLFMAFRYKAMGLVSDISLVVNVICSLAVLSALGATLTLPGIAGIALTIGFAVDANVLINERMREELNKGSSYTYAIKEGYNRAMSAILDANAMVGTTALILLYFGTGPVKGFAVTLLIGIVTTLFANVFTSKVIIDNLVHKFGFKKLSV